MGQIEGRGRFVKRDSPNMCSDCDLSYRTGDCVHNSDVGIFIGCEKQDIAVRVDGNPVRTSGFQRARRICYSVNHRENVIVGIRYICLVALFVLIQIDALLEQHQGRVMQSVHPEEQLQGAE